MGSTALTLAIMDLTLMTLIIVMTGGGPLGATTTLSFEAFRGTVQAVNVGPTAVVSIVVLLINVVLGVIFTRLTGRVTGKTSCECSPLDHQRRRQDAFLRS